LSRREGRRPCYEGSGTEWTRVSSGTGYRLPTEAEWEFACRAGTATEYSFGDDEAMLPEYAVFNKRYTQDDSHTELCGGKLPNAWGIFDMHGNVTEWCHDLYGRYSPEPGMDPLGATMASERVHRGGWWADSPRSCRSAYRTFFQPILRFHSHGFRVAAVPSGE